MALENLVDGMTGLQMANAIKDNFNKVLDAESAENKAENAGKSIKTDYDATRYIELQLADGTPGKMKMNVFCQAIAPVVAEQIGANNTDANSLLKANSFGQGNFNSSLKLFSVKSIANFTISCIIADNNASGQETSIYLLSISRTLAGVFDAKLKPILGKKIHPIKYRINSDGTVEVVLYRTQYYPTTGCFVLSGSTYIQKLMTAIPDSSIDDTYTDITLVE